MQLDSVNRTGLSRDRLYRYSGWRADELHDRWVLEIGCGAGRFTEVLLEAGAHVVAVDVSAAVDACWKNLGPHPRLHVLQADVFELPVRPAAFDFVLCFGVVQHTPRPEEAFRRLLPPLAPAGRLAMDVYGRTARPGRWTSKYLWRWLTKRVSPHRLARFVEWYLPRWLPIDDRLQDRAPRLGRALAALVPCWNYRGIFPLTDAQRLEWAILDTFDALAPAHDHPQSLDAVRGWFRGAGLEDVTVWQEGNGVFGRGRAPRLSSAAPASVRGQPGPAEARSERARVETPVAS